MNKHGVIGALASVLAAAPAPSGTGGAAAHDGSRITVQRDGEPMVEGSGRTSTSSRAAESFTAIAVEGPAALEVVVGPRESVEVEANDNLLDRITTDVDDGTLEIGTRGSFRTRITPVVRVTVRELERLRVRGSGDTRIGGIDGGRLDLVLQGSGDIHVEGRAEAVTANLYGSGNIELARLSAPSFETAVYGTGNIRVHTTGTLSAAVFGTGRIDFSGNPRLVRKDVFGPGSIASVAR